MLTNIYQKNCFRKKNIYIIISFLIILSVFFIFGKKSIDVYLMKKQSYLSQSIKYEKIIKKIDTKKISTLMETNDFVKKNNNIYGIFMAMFLAKQHILNNELDQALTPLQNSLKYSKEENLKHLLWLKIAEIKQEQNKYQDVINALKNIQNHNWTNIIENIKGNIFLAKNEKKEAIKSWKNSQLHENSYASKEIINMKIQDLQAE